MSYPTLRQTLEKFVSDEACHEHLGRIRWPTGPCCPKCKGAHVIRFQAKGKTLYSSMDDPDWPDFIDFYWFEREFFGSPKNLSAFSNLQIGKKTGSFLLFVLILNNF